MEAVPLDDRGLLLADGLFETLLWRAGELMLGEAHAERMIAGAAELGLPAPTAAAFIDGATAAVRDAGLADARAAVRVTLTAGSGGRGLERPTDLAPRLFATAAPTVRPMTPAVLFVASIRRNHASPTSRLKTLAYLDNVLARREAVAAGADEAVMLNTANEVACAAAANVFWIKNGVLFKPPLECGCLDGIMARQVLAAAARLGIETQAVREGPASLAAAEAIFLTNSLIGLRPAQLGPDAEAAHPIAEQLIRAVQPFV